MRKLKRKKIVKEYLEKLLLKYEKRIFALSTASFQLRQQLEMLKNEPTKEPYVKGKETESCPT